MARYIAKNCRDVKSGFFLLFFPALTDITPAGGA